MNIKKELALMERNDWAPEPSDHDKEPSDID